MKDIFGNDIEVGQTVATNYRQDCQTLRTAEVVGFTAHKVKLRMKDKYIALGFVEFLKFPEQIAVKK